MHRLRVERRCETFARRRLATQREHVLGDVAAVDIEAGSEIREQQAPGAAGDVQSRLPRFDVPLEVLDLLAALVELGPPAGNDAVMPGGSARLLHLQD